jgi:mRNA interferase MazF
MRSRWRGKRTGGTSSVRRGEIRWYTFAAPDKRRPVLLLSRDLVVERLSEFIVVPATRTIRGINTEMVLTEEDGMPVACALNFDHISLAKRDRVGVALTNLKEERWVEVRRALLTACGFERGD